MVCMTLLCALLVRWRSYGCRTSWGEMRQQIKSWIMWIRYILSFLVIFLGEVALRQAYALTCLCMAALWPSAQSKWRISCWLWQFIFHAQCFIYNWWQSIWPCTEWGMVLCWFWGIDRKVKLIAIKLKKYASLWWENLKRQREREGRRKIVTWEKMKKELKRKFLPDNYRQDIYLKFHNFKQKELSVEDYTAEFDNLMMKCDLVEAEEHTIDHDGLVLFPHILFNCNIYNTRGWIFRHKPSMAPCNRKIQTGGVVMHLLSFKIGIAKCISRQSSPLWVAGEFDVSN